MNPRRLRLRLSPIALAVGLAAATLVIGGGGVAAEVASPAKLGAGAAFETLQAGKTTYQNVKVRSVNARTLMISHAGGIASIRLRDLSPELQAAFGYDPEVEAAA